MSLSPSCLCLSFKICQMCLWIAACLYALCLSACWGVHCLLSAIFLLPLKFFNLSGTDSATCFPTCPITATCFPVSTVTATCFPASTITTTCFPTSPIKATCFPAPIYYYSNLLPCFYYWSNLLTCFSNYINLLPCFYSYSNLLYTTTIINLQPVYHLLVLFYLVCCLYILPRLSASICMFVCILENIILLEILLLKELKTYGNTLVKNRKSVYVISFCHFFRQQVSVWILGTPMSPNWLTWHNWSPEILSWKILPWCSPGNLPRPNQQIIVVRNI